MKHPATLPTAARRLGAQLALGVTVAFSLLLLASNAQAQEWKVVRKENGITVSQKEVPGRGLPTFRGASTINANLYEVLAILADFDSHCKWMHGCHTAKLLKEFDDYHRISYNRTDAPWPIDDRDAVLESQIEVQSEKHTILIRFKSIKSALMPEVDGVVRMNTTRGYYMLTAVSPTKTRVQYEVDADPGGFLPDWVVVMAAEDVPYNTLTNLRKRAAQSKGQHQTFIDHWDPDKNPEAPRIVPAE